MDDASSALSDPVLNNPYDEPSCHFELDANGPTGAIVETRRPSEFFVPVPKPKKGKGKQIEQVTFDFDSLTGERIQRNDKIDQLRDALRDWRRQNYPGVTAITASSCSIGQTPRARTASSLPNERQPRQRSSSPKSSDVTNTRRPRSAALTGGACSRRRTRNTMPACRGWR